MPIIENTAAATAEVALRDFIEADRFPCVGAKAALVRDAAIFHTYGSLGDNRQSEAFYDDISNYVATIDPSGMVVQTFVAIFPEAISACEKQFEAALWDQLSILAGLDRLSGTAWSKEVSSDPQEATFSMSVAGHPFFVIGLHPAASRAARRAPFEALVFNSTLQFEALRADGRYDQLQAIIRRREMQFNGSLNPMLDAFGDRSEARQYSGRSVEESWTCPMGSKLKTT